MEYDFGEVIKYIIVTAICAAVVYSLYEWAHWYATHPCLASHVETQYEAPPSVVVGGGKYGGGVAIPVGNLRPVQVTVCDRR